MHKAEIISIGSELLSGKTVDTTSSFISRKLANIGISTTQKITVPDETKEIIKAIKHSWNRASIVIITGGLGPTRDDITKTALAKAFGLKLKHNPKIETSIRQFYKKLGKRIPPLCLNQAFLPEGPSPLLNSWGTAPGIYLKEKNKRLFVLPGVPHETTNMMTHRVMPILLKELGKKKNNAIEINIFGIGESAIEEKLEQSLPTSLKIAFLPDAGCVKLILSGNVSDKNLRLYSGKIEKRFKENVFSRGEVSLEEALSKILKRKKLQLSVAESCTGGMLGSRIVSLSGASSFFAGGVITYSNESKTKLIGVSHALIKKHGAVSIPVAKAMARGAAKKFVSHCSIAITGVAGPKGGTKEKPVGLVCIASCCNEDIVAESFNFYGDRSFIRQRAVQTALFQMLSLLKKI